MTYQSKHTLMKWSKEGYNTVAKEYKNYHTYLNTFDIEYIKKYFPRGKENISIIDLGAGDGRLYPLLNKLPHIRYVACDISEQLLKQHPGTKNIEKILCNLEETLPFKDESFDFAITCFVLEHLPDSDHFFQEGQRILKIGARRVLNYFPQRHEFLRNNKNNPLKIQLYNHRIENLVKDAENNWFTVDNFHIKEKGHIMGYILVLEKN